MNESNGNNNQTSSDNNEYDLNIDYYIEEAILIFGLFTVSVNILVFYQLRVKDTAYKFLLLEAIVDFAYLLLLSLSVFVYCGTPCNAVYTSIWGKLFNLAIDDYLTSGLAINNILIEIVLSLQRLFIITNKPWLSDISFVKTSLVIGVVALLFYLPLLILNKIVQIGPNQYDLVAVSGHALDSIIPTLISSMRLFLATIGLFSINLVTFVYFKRHMKRKSKLLSKNNKAPSAEKRAHTVTATYSNNELEMAATVILSKRRYMKKQKQKTKRNLTLMIFSISVLYALGTMPWAICFSMVSFLSVVSEIFTGIAISFLFLLVSLKTFVYYFFNKMFKAIVDGYYSRILTCFK